eukprot:CAMPEP_0206631140 /NCGR_PEP_ID=MMETSP0325_2-20121206/68002_1 /ASSEMBLY_ACC=CAM_ASM_000347 /TAXON_ID=2866 /ORGANISM="Crypthecodinium cohnii, Strain Seligo" /LENGTH=96 /DNA_ID=CAMNT_0054156155 /DNA_START=11 /DNA_END=299 /DNA_ORIENTATION=-
MTLAIFLTCFSRPLLLPRPLDADAAHPHLQSSQACSLRSARDGSRSGDANKSLLIVGPIFLHMAADHSPQSMSWQTSAHGSRRRWLGDAPARPKSN